VRGLWRRLFKNQQEPLRLLDGTKYGTCSSYLYIHLQELEARVIDGLHALLMDPEILQDFATVFVQEMSRLLAHENSS